MNRILTVGLFLVVICMLFVPAITSAHEPYVLDAKTVAHAVAEASPNPFSAIPDEELLFIVWGVIMLVIVGVVLRLSLSPALQKACDPTLIKLKRYAPLIVRVTLGISLIASGYYGALFGPEISLESMFGSLSDMAGIALIVLGLLITFGWRTREAAVGVLLFVVYALIEHRVYMLMYFTYIGALLVVLILGSGSHSLDHRYHYKAKRLPAAHTRYAFLIMRLSFGLSIVFASFYAKFIHSNLALATVQQYGLAEFLPFTPLFLVLGAFLVEVMIGVFLAIGFEIRFFTFVFIVFLIISMCFFREAVWPHLILFGINMALFTHGYDSFTLEKAMVGKKNKVEPVL